jgi:hypothetical protein
MEALTPEKEVGTRRMIDYKGWRFGIASELRDLQWTARIDAYPPGTNTREISPLVVAFTGHAFSEAEIMDAAAQEAHRFVDQQDRVDQQERGR